MDKDVDADINDEDDSPVDEKELNDLEDEEDKMDDEEDSADDADVNDSEDDNAENGLEDIEKNTQAQSSGEHKKGKGADKKDGGDKKP